jgi:ATP-binding cassette subfamily C protein
MTEGPQSRLFLQFCRRFAQHDRAGVSAHIIVTLVLAALQGISIVMLVPLLSELGVPGETDAGPIAAIAFRIFDVLRLPHTLGAILMLYLVLVVSRAALERQRMLTDARLQLEFVRALRTELHAALLHAEWRFLAMSRKSDFIQVLTTDVQRAGQAALLVLTLMTGIVMMLVYVAIAFTVSPGAAALSIGVAGGLAWLLRGSVRRARESGDDLTTRSNRLYATLSEHLGGLAEIRSYGAEPLMKRSFAQAVSELDATRFDFALTQSNARFWMTVGGAATLASLAFVAVSGLQLPLASLLLLIYLFARIVPQATQLQTSALQLKHALPAFATVNDLLVKAQSAAEAGAGRPAPDLTRAITFDNVDYHHPRSNAGVRALSFAIGARQTTALVGESGSGKTTTAMILMGFLAPQSGRVLIDGVALEPSMHRAWRSRIGFVPQDTFLLHDTIRANLCLARPDADETALWHALELADAADFVRALPEGLDTIAGDRGMQFSGGERQRIALARALVAQPEVLILDEATNAVDLESERRIFDALARLRGKLTVVVITHRPGIAEWVDHVIVLAAGGVIETRANTRSLYV